MDKVTLTLKAYQSNVEIHRHSAYQIVFTEDNHFDSTLENETHRNLYGFVIRPQIAHACECSSSTLFIINIEANSFLARYIAKKLSLSNAALFRNVQELKSFFNIEKNDFTYLDIININQTTNPKHLTDERIAQAINFIDKNFQSEKFSINNLALHVFLSPSRLSSIFKQQTGSSITRFLLWTRLRSAIFKILSEKKKSIGTIAIESGFYDTSQMNKYMYQMFGISPIRLRQKSDLIQFLEAEHG